MNVLTISCDECRMQHTPACEECVVSFICERDPAAASSSTAPKCELSACSVAQGSCPRCFISADRSANGSVADGSRVVPQQMGALERPSGPGLGLAPADVRHPDRWRQRMETGGHSCHGGGGGTSRGLRVTEPESGRGRTAADRPPGRTRCCGHLRRRSVSRHPAGAARAGRPGWSAGMQFTYRNPERSTNPGATLPGAAAIVVGARRYERRLEPRRSTGTDRRRRWRSPEGRVAMYAWVDHYRPLRAALGQVADHLRQRRLAGPGAGRRQRPGGSGGRGPSRRRLVREEHQRAACPALGSWFVLGSVVTDAPLTAGAPPPTPVPDGCGPCERCLSACPTGALVGAGTIGRAAVSRLVAAGTGRVPGRVSGGARRSALRVRRLPDGVPYQPARHSSTPAGRARSARPAVGGHPRPAEPRRWSPDGAGRPVVHPRTGASLRAPKCPDHSGQHRRSGRSCGRRPP